MKTGLLLAISFLFSLSSHASATLDELTFITEEYPPYNYRLNDRLEGVSIEVLEAVFEITGSSLSRDDVHYLPWARGYETALSEPDTVLFSTTRTAQRESLFKWVGPIARDRVTLLARRDSGIHLNDLTDLSRYPYRIAVIREDIGAQRLIEGGIDAEQLRPAISNLSALKMLERGRVDLWAYGEDVAFWLMEQHGIDTRLFESVYTLSESELYFAFNEDTDDRLVESMQAALDRLHEQGRMDTILGSGITFNTEEYPPFNYLDAEQRLDGVGTRVLQATLADARRSANFRLLPWARAYTEARLREDHCVYSTTRTPEREPDFIWVGPLLNSVWSAFVPADSDIDAASLEDLEGLRVGSFREDAVGQYVEAQGIPIVVAPQERDNIHRLGAGLIDVWVTGTLTARQLSNEAGLPLRELFSFHQADLYLACHPSVSRDFLNDLQSSLNRLSADGRLAQIERELLQELGISR